MAVRRSENEIHPRRYFETTCHALKREYMLAAMLRVTRRELTRAYRQSRRYCVDLSIDPHKLLALYCIECGLKALILREQRVESTDALPAEVEIGHDLLLGLTVLRAPASLFGLNRLRISTRHDKEPQQTVAPKNLHQALRYGIPMSLQTEVSRELSTLMAWLEEQFDAGN